MGREVKESAAKHIFPPLPRLGPIGFLRSLLTVGCLWFPLILFESRSGRAPWVWVAWIGYLILGLIWLIQWVRRMEDAGYRLLGRGFGFLLGLLLTRTFRLFSFRHSSKGHFDPYDDLARFIPALPLWLRHFNGYEMLALFLLVQSPLALLPSRPRALEPPPSRKRENKYAKQLSEWQKTHKPFLVGRFAFLRRLSVIAVLWVPLIYMDGFSNGGVGTWIARFGYLVLTYAWLMNSDGRLKEAGWRPLDSWQYQLVIGVATLMPLALHWVNGYGALALFVSVQIPTALLKGKQSSPDPALGDPLQTNQEPG